MLKRQGIKVNRKKLYRLYKEERRSSASVAVVNEAWASGRPWSCRILQDPRLSALVHDIGVLSEYVRSKAVLAALLKRQGSNPKRLLEIAKLGKAVGLVPIAASDITLVTSFSLEKLRLLEAAIDEIEGMHVFVFGYLFAGKKLRATAKLLSDQCKIECERPTSRSGQTQIASRQFPAPSRPPGSRTA